MITLNLLPIKEGLKYRKQLKEFTLFFAIIILIIVANVVFYTRHSTLVEEQQVTVNKLEKDIEQYKNLLGDLKKEQTKREAFLRRINSINSLEKLRKNLLKILNEVNKQIPHKTWLITLDKKGNVMKLTGGASSYENVTRFAHSLKAQANTFSKVEITEVHSENYTGKVSANKFNQKLKYLAFKIDCLLK
jgi:type IV pilus assembly protein PilN